MSQKVFPNDNESSNKPRSKRLVSIDLLRGLVMVLMALDHVRYFFSNARFDPLDLTKTNIPLFLTRWVTHLCAPTFIFLAGVAAYLSLRQINSKPELCRYLLIRGLWLIFLEIAVVNFSWMFDLTYRVIYGEALWAIGWSMIILAGLVYIPTRTVGVIGMLLILGHNLFDNIHSEQLGKLGWLWAILHEPKMLQPFPGIRFYTLYPLIPWIGVMAVGYAFATVFKQKKAQRYHFLKRLGIGLILAFIIVRGINVYGDPDRWSIQPSISFTLLSFINCHKYPPSLLYLLITLGSAIVMLALFESQVARKLLQPLVLFGRVPLFFYIIHIPLIHLAAIMLALPKYGSQAFSLSFQTPPPDYGYDLPMVYSITIILVILLYPTCYWFANYKSTHKYEWLNYL